MKMPGGRRKGMEWSGCSDRVKVDKGKYGSVDVEVYDLDIHSAIDNALLELYFFFEDSFSISLEINNIIIIFNECNTPTIQVYGRKYRAKSNVFLMPAIYLGEISKEKWTEFDIFHKEMQPKVEQWINAINNIYKIDNSYEGK